MKYIFIFVILFSVSRGQSSALNATTKENISQTPKIAKDSSTKNALTFINAYVKNCNQMKDAVGIIEWVKSNKLTTQRFKTILKRTIEEANKLEPEIGLGFDPIFDAQDYPEKGFEIASIDYKTNYIVVKGKDWQDFKLTIKMVKANNNWLVDGCGIINIPKSKRAKR